MGEFKIITVNLNTIKLEYKSLKKQFGNWLKLVVQNPCS